MTTLHADTALTPQGWQKDVRLSLEAGRIARIVIGTAPEPGDERDAL
ncbi:formimidoylglutamate deiminase, partial [Rhizobium leguminosarum]